MKWAILFSLSLMASAQATRRTEPYKLVIIADENSETRANQFITYLRTQPPFSQIASEDLQISVTRAPPGAMNCQSPHPETQESQRLVTCDQRALRRIQRQQRANFAVAITSVPAYYGGSGGQIPVGTVGAPDSVILHEMLHSYGLEDEYTYRSAAEIRRYCRPGNAGPNIAFFRDVPPYASDPAARVTHASEVPWMGRISADMPITQLPALGSPSRTVVRGGQQIGLYRGGNCPDAANGKKSWKPLETSIMNGHEDDYVYPIYADVVSASIRRSLGRNPRLITAAKGNVPGTEVRIDSPTPGIGEGEEKGSEGTETISQ